MATQNTDDEDSKAARMRAQLFQSTDSVTDILRQEMFKSVVSNELNSLSSINSAAPAAEEATSSTAAALKPPALSSTRSSSSGGGGAFFESMLATLKSRQSTLSNSGNPTNSVAFTAGTKPSAKAIEDLTSSKNWNNLGSLEDVDVANVFKTQQENHVDGTSSGAATAVAALPFSSDGKKKKSKTDWDKIMKQSLQASIIVPPPPEPSAAAAATKGKTTKEAVVPNPPPVDPPPVEEAVQSDPEVAVAAAVAAVAKSHLPQPTAATSSVAANKKKNSKKRARVKEEPKPKSKKGGTSEERVYYEPTDQDVLLGRGGRANNHIGNKKYLELKDSIQDRYMAAEKAEKTAISEELMEMVKKWGGRFLKLDETTNQWYEVDRTTARKKCSQTLREINTPEVRLAKRQKYNK